MQMYNTNYQFVSIKSESATAGAQFNEVHEIDGHYRKLELP
jgi:hypothetical protein